MWLVGGVDCTALVFVLVFPSSCLFEDMYIQIKVFVSLEDLVDLMLCFSSDHWNEID